MFVSDAAQRLGASALLHHLCVLGCYLAFGQFDCFHCFAGASQDYALGKGASIKGTRTRECDSLVRDAF